MAIRSLLTQAMKRGIGSLRPKPKPKVNRRWTPEEIAERKALAKYSLRDKATEFVPPYMPGASSQVMRAKKVGDETMDMIRASVMKMDLPPAKKIEAIKSAATTLRNANSAQLAKADPTKLAKDILKIGLGAGAGYGIADNKEAIAEMLKSVKLPPAVDNAMTPARALLEKAGITIGDPAVNVHALRPGGMARGIVGEAIFGPEQSLWERNSQISDDTSWPAPNPFDPTDNMRMFGFDYTEPDPEPGLEEGSIADLLLFNRLFGD